MLLTSRRCALITGAMSFLGSKIVEALSDDLLVLKTGTRQNEDRNYFQADLTSQKETEEMIKWATAQARIDYLICCAGGVTSSKINDAYHITQEEIIDSFNKNVITAANCCRYVVPLMIENNSGRICFIGSDLVGHPKDNGALTNYIISKAALHEYTIHLANQLKDTDIKVNCVSPCGIYGSSRTPSSNDVSVEKVVAGVKNLCSPQALTGQIIRVIK